MYYCIVTVSHCCSDRLQAWLVPSANAAPFRCRHTAAELTACYRNAAMQDVSLVSDDSVSWEGIPKGGLQITESPGQGVRPWRLPVADLDLFVREYRTPYSVLRLPSVL